jgi:photosystem II stability/assembly factor-like uncharacterized protein
VLAATRTAFGIAVAIVCVAASRPPGYAQESARPTSDIYNQLRWRFIGPEGNRVTAVAGVAGDPLVYYVGAASGGIFKTTDGGVHWDPIFDDQPVASIGSLAVVPSNPNVVWAGTGEAFISNNVSIGEGVFKSNDAGRTWTRMGLERTGRIGRLVIDPADPNVVQACALGHAYGPQPDRGVFRTTDGGKSWTRVLFVDENTGCSDLAIDPKNPRILFAGMWQIEIHTWGRDSGGPGSGLFTSRDGGATWKRLTGNGLPTRPIGKVAVAIAPSDPKRVYALIETGDGVPWRGMETDRGHLWRSDDGGDTWRMVNADRIAMARPHYYTRLAVAPDNANETYYLAQAFSKSIDGGQTIVLQPRHAEAPAADHHDMWIDPTNANRMIVGADLGMSISVDRGQRWNRLRLPIAQMYRVTVDNQIPYYVYGNRQDGPSYRGPSNSRLELLPGGGNAGIPRALWHSVGGGESGWATPDPVDPDVVWSTASGSGSVGGIVARYEESRRQFRNVEVWPDEANGPPADLKYRFFWTAPLAISPHDRHKLYVGSQHVHQTTDGGQTWQVISPDLTLDDKSRQQSSGGLTPEDNGADYIAVVSIAESPRQPGLIWAGTNDGVVQLTRDGGKTWTSVAKSIANLPPLGTISNIEPSRYDAGAAYIAVDLHAVNNRDPFIYKTTDYGQSWKAITAGIPRGVLSYVHCVREDPVRRGLLYAGTENGIYVSFDDGEKWQPLQMNLPHAPVNWIAVQEHFNDLVIATYGRGFWILDDLTPLQQMTPRVLESDAHLFPPRPAYRFRLLPRLHEVRDEDPNVGQNPSYGADINYYLKGTPGGNVTVTILDRQGRSVRTLAGTTAAGINRIQWDLRYEPTRDVRLRTGPLFEPEVRAGPEGRPAPGAGRLSILAPPGTYTVKLTAGGREVTQPLIVRKDPHSAGTEADIQAQMTMLFDLRRDIERAADVVDGIEHLRIQVEPLARGQDAAIKKSGDDLDKKLIAVEQNLLELRLTGRGDQWGSASRLFSKLNYLASQLASGDFRPTGQQVEVQKLLEDRLAACESQLAALRTRELTALNELLRMRKVPEILAKPVSR